MRRLAAIGLFDDPAQAARRRPFRGRDNWSISDRRDCLPVPAGERVSFPFDLGPDDARPGRAEVVLTACLEVHGSHAYIRRHLNSVLELHVNGAPVFSGVLHWRSHEETVAFWNPFDFPFDAALLRPGRNTLTLINRTARDTLGEFFDPQLADALGEAEALRQLSLLHLSSLEVNFRSEPIRYPILRGVPPSAVAGRPFLIEVSTGPDRAAVSVERTANARVRALGAELEFGEHRALFEVVPEEPRRPCAVGLRAAGADLRAEIARVYGARRAPDLVAGPGAETTYWHQLLEAVQDFFALDTGTCFRISIDDFLANLHFIPVEQWRPLIAYLVRRRRHYALQRLRVPPYSRIQHHELAVLADMGPGLFAGVAVPEPILHLGCGEGTGPQDLEQRLRRYLDYFRERMDAVRLPGHPLLTFDSGGGAAGHYYAMGLDAHVSEIGPACNCFEEACARGAASVCGKPWGVAAAMHWYFGQGGNYAYDDARVRLAWLTMLSSYLAGARHIVWEGGCFDNLPVYNYVLTPESWRDYGRRYADPEPTALRACFRRLLDFERAQQLPPPTVRFGVLQGQNDVFRPVFSAEESVLGDLSIVRAGSLLRVFLPHFSYGRHGVDHTRPTRRWYSSTPHGQVDVVPAHADAAHLRRYRLLALLAWNTMTDAFHARLLDYVRSGGVLFAAFPHFVADTRQQHVWTPWRGGDWTELCGVRAGEVGRRVESVRFLTGQFERRLPRDLALARKNPLFVEDFDETYPVFSHDVTYVAGELDLAGAEVLAESQAGEPVLLRKRHGAGAAYLLNSYHHPGRGHWLELAEGILRTLVEEQPSLIRVEDPRQVVSWFEYAEAGWKRFLFLNTDWTAAGNRAPVTVRIGGGTLAFDVPEGAPVQLLTDGRGHALLTDPSLQPDWGMMGS